MIVSFISSFYFIACKAARCYIDGDFFDLKTSSGREEK